MYRDARAAGRALQERVAAELAALGDKVDGGSAVAEVEAAADHLEMLLEGAATEEALSLNMAVGAHLFAESSIASLDELRVPEPLADASVPLNQPHPLLSFQVRLLRMLPAFDPP